MKKLKSISYRLAKQSIPFLGKLLGVNLLDKQGTLKKLEKFRLFFEESDSVIIPPAGIKSAGLPENFSESGTVTTSAIAVYSVSGAHAVKVYNYGGIRIGNDLPDMDFGPALFIKTVMRRDKRPLVECGTCIVLWAHHWGSGYYDYLFFIFAKLLRIKSSMTDESFSQAKIAYPVFGTAFEKELLGYAGVAENQLIDVRKFNVTADNYMLANNESWYFHHKRDLLLLRSTLLPIANKAISANERIYIQRKGRRALTNETEVINILNQFGFTIIEDRPRTVAEQVAIYHNAKVIIGPHGASFANVINCKPGAIFIELFPNSYYPDYFRYLASVLELQYFALFEDALTGNHYRNVNKDMVIDPDKVKHLLAKLLG